MPDGLQPETAAAGHQALRGHDVSRECLRINRFGFAEYDDMAGIVRETDLPAMAETLRQIVELVLAEDESGLVEAMTMEAQADFAVPLGMAAEMLRGDRNSDMELVAAACTVRYSAERHMDEFPRGLATLLRRLPR
ncbi:hypothetical protein [Streptomyces sp. NPDC060275]|uniref:hypothetical protein n=1 Tax=Streptomyces sp. NPDC060275 TaxID=3347090 RepID=UPI0036546B0A